ncbi:molybdopterin-dependent oxidoreductase [Campylobacter sp. RM13119]|uniref:molybdopterin-dependent oxidoreductase n=1 Tax=Campylobacter californiensis TaxID=1032243 RepID=UPI0014767867|nr:molybdopterin-dependent oxidoreductase [Campylobacter sp. RM13119]MBE3606903.1 molybdopterin-dependent oxidoreductase [Campylobacter sp. RM13119]
MQNLNTEYKSERILGANRLGIFWANFKDGKFTHISDFEGDKSPNILNYALPELLQSKTRVLYPMVRKSYLQNNGVSKNELRGKEEFVRVSWDKALDLAAKALKDSFEKYGAQSIYGECYWWGGSGKIGFGRSVAHRMLSLLGGYVRESGDYSTGAGLVIMPHVLGSSAVYDKSTKWKAVIKNAKNVVFWGTNPIITSQISGTPPTHDGYECMKELKNTKNIKCYSVDVMTNETAKFFNSENIIVRPNTDVALMLGMCHYLLVNNLYDDKFITTYTVGFDKFKAYLLGQSDGVVKDISWASKICGVDVQDIIDFTKKISREKTTILIGRSLQRADHGEQVFWALVALNSMLGYIGMEGLGFEFSLGYSASGAQDKIAPKLKSINSNPNKNAKLITIPSSRFIEALAGETKELDYNGIKINLPNIKVGYFASGSLFTRHQDVNNIIRNWHKLDTVITAEPYWTSTAKLSDIVFPVALEIERNDINQSSNTNEYILAYKPITTPAGESKSDFWICEQICKRWGLGEAFSEGKDELGWMREIYNEAKEDAKKLDIEMPEFNEFYQEGFVKFDKDNKDSELYTRLSDFRADPKKFALNTPSGKIELYSEVIAGFGYEDCPAHPAWLEPFEWLGDEELTEKYPLHLVSAHSRYRLHSQLNNSVIGEFASVACREPILINPQDANLRALQNGDIVRVFSARGEILAGVFISEAVPKNVCVICEGAWYDPEILGEESLCKHGCVNVLTRDKGSSKLSQSNTSHTTLVQVEKFKGEIKPITAFSKPNIVESI